MKEAKMILLTWEQTKDETEFPNGHYGLSSFHGITIKSGIED